MATTGALAYDIVPTSLAVTAMRDNGYKNAAYAVAELMDNSIQANASLVELLCADDEVVVDQRVRKRLDRVAVLDNGDGMNSDTLQMALQFGNGTRLKSGTRHGMGRFGMGLPSASISQCRRVDVWTWQHGVDSALHTYVDLDEIDRGDLREIPTPQVHPIPQVWQQAGKGIRDSGTLVVWSKIDRCLWRTSRALITNSEQVIGRMYRYWLHQGHVGIRLASFVSEASTQMLQDVEARPNDPLYLMPHTSCPEPFTETPMFRPFPSPDGYEIKPTIRFRGDDHTVTIRLSIAREDARPVDSTPGNLPHGQHAGRNAGVSVVRSGRELELDSGWTRASEPRDRWWGVEVCFEPGLDELFGVSNNKQYARNFAEAAKLDAKALAQEHEGSISEARKALEDEEDPLAPLLEVIFRVQTNIDQMRNQIRSQGSSKGGRRTRHTKRSVEEDATDAVRQRREQGHPGQSDNDETEEPDKRKQAVTEHYRNQGRAPEEATRLAGETIDAGLKYRMDTAALEAGAFFSVQSRGGILLVTLNTDHPAYNLLLGAQTPESLPDDPGELKERVLAAQEGLEMMLFAWARYEDEQASPELRRHAQNVRHDWGRMAESFLEVRGSNQA